MTDLITSTLSEELEKLGNRISEDLTSTLVGFDGSLKDIDNGTLIKIPMAAGYVTLSTFLNDSKQTCLRLRLWMTEELYPDPMKIEEEDEVELEDKYD